MKQNLRAGLFSLVIAFTILNLCLTFQGAQRQPASQPAPASAAWINNNAIWDLVCISQGQDVAPGSPAALKWGSAPYPGTTGGAEPYGYRHLHEFNSLPALEKDVALRAIFASTTARHCAYAGAGARVRQAGYQFAMRPLQWMPELANDLSKGATAWKWNGATVEYFNLDEQHAWSFLFDVAETTGNAVPFIAGLPNYETVDARLLARARLEVESAGIAGMARHPWMLAVHKSPNDSSDRAYARLIDWLVRAHRLGVLAPEDGEAGIAFVEVAASFYGQIPGISIQTKTQTTVPPVPEGTPYFMPAQTAWAAAALYDAAEALGMGHATLAASLRASSQRLCRWVAESFWEDARLPWVVTLPPAAFAGESGRPLQSILPFFSSDSRHDPGFDAGPWAYRAMCCGAAMGNSLCAMVRDKLLIKWRADPEQWTWLVDEKWQYSVAAAAELAKGK